jgi:hypothetical protein
VYDSADQIARARSLRKRRKAAANKLSYVIMLPVFVAFFALWREPTMAWLYANAVLPDYGVMQFMDGRPSVDWDRVLVAGVVGAVIGGVGYMIARPLVGIFVR